MAPETLGAVIGATFTGLTGLIVALAGLRRSRNAQLREELQECYLNSQVTQSRLLSAISHIGQLEEILAWNRLVIPSRPPLLDAGRIGEQPDDWQPQHVVTS